MSTQDVNNVFESKQDIHLTDKTRQKSWHRLAHVFGHYNSRGGAMISSDDFH